MPTTSKRNIILLKKMRHPKTYVPPQRDHLKMFIVIIASGAFYEDVLSTLMHINVYTRVYTRSAEWCICLGDPKGAGHYKKRFFIDSLDWKRLSESCIQLLRAMTLVSEHCQKYKIFQNLLFIFSIKLKDFEKMSNFHLKKSLKRSWISPQKRSSPYTLSELKITRERTFFLALQVL